MHQHHLVAGITDALKCALCSISCTLKKRQMTAGLGIIQLTCHCVTLKVENVGLEAASMRPFPLLPPMSLDLGIFLTVTSALKETRWGRFPSADDETPPSSVKSSSERSESDRFTLADGGKFIHDIHTTL